VEATTIELCVRRASDVPTFRAVAQALRPLGLFAELRLAAGAPNLEVLGVRARSGACSLRVVIETGPELLRGVPRDGAPLVVLWDSCVPVERAVGAANTLAEWRELRAIAVPGEAHARALELRFPGALEVTGLARLDGLRMGLPAARAEARSELGLSSQAEVVTYVPSRGSSDSALALIGARICDLCKPDRIVLLVARSWNDEQLERHRRFAASRAGLLLLEDEALASAALLAADLVIGDPAGAIWEARALGIRTLSVDTRTAPLGFDHAMIIDPRVGVGPEFVQAVDATLARPESQLAGDLDALRCDGGAAARIADLLQSIVRQPGDVGTAGSGSGREVFARIEARTAFGETEQATQELRSYLDDNPSAEGYALLASIQRRAGNLEAAVSAAERAVQLGREGAAKALCERARVDVERGEFGVAREQFEQAQQLCPDLPELWIGQGSLDLHAGDPTSAEERFRTALDLEKSGRAWSGLGLALCAQGRFREALSPLESALELDPDGQAALFGLVQAGFQTGELQVPARRLERFVEAHPGNLDFVFTLAGLRCELGDRQGALDCVARIEVFDPNYAGLAELRQKLEG